MAKLDRLARDSAFLMRVFDGNVPLLFGDLPEIDGSAASRFMSGGSMYWHDLRRPSTYIMLVTIVALGIKNYILWSAVDLKAVIQHPWPFPSRVDPVRRMWPTLPRLRIERPCPRKIHIAGRVRRGDRRDGRGIHGTGLTTRQWTIPLHGVDHQRHGWSTHDEAIVSPPAGCRAVSSSHTKPRAEIARKAAYLGGQKNRNKPLATCIISCIIRARTDRLTQPGPRPCDRRGFSQA